MLTKLEYQKYRDIIESEETRGVMASLDPNSISILGGNTAAYYARMSGELAEIKDEIDREYLRLIKPVEEGGEGMKVTAAEKAAEVNVNQKHQVSRREIDYLMKALDKISFACSARCRSFAKEGNF